MNPDYRDEHLEIGRAILGSGAICNECLGRPFARVGRGMTNEERGQAIRALLREDGKAGTCWVCGNVFERSGAWADRAVRAVRGVEFHTYLFGVRLTPRLEETDALFVKRFPSEQTESMKHAFNRVVGKAFEARLERAATVEFSAPDVSFVVDLAEDRLLVHIASLYASGRYRKLARGIPQTKWPCRRCRGRGCSSCGFTGKQYPESVEEWIAAPLLEAAGAEVAHLHGAGREDIDARMLGSGRPFVLEIAAPRKRTLDLSMLANTVNEHAAGRVEISPLAWATRGMVARLKEEHATKRYRARVEFEMPVSPVKLDNALQSLCGQIEQRTPQRVSHRRADRVRRRRLLSAAGFAKGPKEAVIEVEGEGGLYIKELISGDDGRTNPSLTGRLGIRAVVRALDVMDVRSVVLPGKMDSVDKETALP